MSTPPASHRTVNIRGYKWPQRPQSWARVHLLGEDGYGRWIGARAGEPWWSLDGTRSGVYLASVVKVIPHGTYWTACFQGVDPVVDVDIVLPPIWHGDVIEEIDLELDVVKSRRGDVRVRDRDEWDRVQATWPVPEDLVASAERTCADLLERVRRGDEPFSTVGFAWLRRLETGHP